jgi:hypothetical protein
MDGETTFDIVEESEMLSRFFDRDDICREFFKTDFSCTEVNR